MATGQVQSFVDGRMVRNASIDELRQEFEMRYFGRILPASENPNSNVAEAVTVGGGLVAGGAGVVTSGIIGFAGRYC